MTTLFDPATLGKLTLSNRLVMAPMSRNRATAEGLATPLMAEYYAQRAGAGLIVTESTQPSVVGQGFISTPGMHSAEQVDAWRVVTDAVHEAGGQIVCQLMHSGRIGHPSLYPSAHQSVAPSPICAAGQQFTPDGMQDYHTPRELTADEIAETIDDFATASRNAMDAGFDGVELHGGNGFLLHQFLADGCNQRTDAYGGSIENRIRFTVEVVEAAAAAIGPDRVGLRISPANPYNDISESDTGELYAALLRALPAIAFVHVMEAGNRSQTQALREVWTGPLILNAHPDANSFPSTPEIAAEAVESGFADAACLGEFFLANPDLVQRIKAGGPYNTSDQSTFYGGDHRGYTDYPTLS
jgi:N-ethylmaleimide reductase